MRRALLLLLAAVLPVLAWAAECTQYRPRYNGNLLAGFDGWQATYQAAGAQGVAWLKSVSPQCSYNGQTANHGFRDEVFTETSWKVNRYCPVYPNDTGTNYQGTIESRTGNYCDDCSKNITEKKLARVGWVRGLARSDGALYRTVDGRDYFGSAGNPEFSPEGKEPPPIVCDGLCEFVSDGAAGEPWVSTTPSATGLHAVYRDQMYMSTGATCNAKTPETNPDAPSPACDGFTGEVNGVSRCVAKETPGTMGPEGPKLTPTPAGSTPVQATDTSGLPKRLGPNGENPGKGGDRPGLLDLSGTGKGVPSTPSTGTTTKADGTKETMEFDIEVCGLPGKPACRMDESGTPDGKGALDGPTGVLTQGQTDVIGALNQHKALQAPAWSWTFALPSGCTALTLEAFAIVLDICQWQGMIHSLMSIAWIMAAVFLGLRMVHSTMTRT